MYIPLSVTLKNVICDLRMSLIRLWYMQCALYSIKWQLLVVSQSVVALMLKTYAGGWSTRGKLTYHSIGVYLQVDPNTGTVDKKYNPDNLPRRLKAYPDHLLSYH